MISLCKLEWQLKAGSPHVSVQLGFRQNIWIDIGHLILVFIIRVRADCQAMRLPVPARPISTEGQVLPGTFCGRKAEYRVSLSCRTASTLLRDLQPLTSDHFIHIAAVTRNLLFTPDTTLSVLFPRRPGLASPDEPPQAVTIKALQSQEAQILTFHVFILILLFSRYALNNKRNICDRVRLF